jgi:predicted ferric reductase
MKNLLKGFAAVPLLVTIFLWLSGSFSLLTSGDVSSILLALARICGLMAALSVLLQFLLMGRVKWIERVWGMDVLAKIHHKNGRYAWYLMITHFVLILSSYSISSGISVWSQLLQFISLDHDFLFALIGICLFTAIAITSIYLSKLKWPYELWYFVHLATYIAILLVFGHQHKFGGDFITNLSVIFWYGLYIFVFVNVVYFRFTKVVWQFYTHRFYVKSVTKETETTTNIIISGKNMNAVSRIPGQFVIVRFFDKSRFWQAHPFSISGSKANGDIRLTIKDSGDFTHLIKGLTTGTPVVVDGPHGGFTHNRMVKKDAPVAYLAAGIGITPLLSMLSSAPAGATLLYSNKDSVDIPLKSEIDQLIALGARVYYFVTESEKVPKWAQKGRIDAISIRKNIPDFAKREFFVCGPRPFLDAMRETLIELKVSNDKIHSEKFSLH